MIIPKARESAKSTKDNISEFPFYHSSFRRPSIVKNAFDAI